MSILTRNATANYAFEYEDDTLLELQSNLRTSLIEQQAIENKLFRLIRLNQNEALMEEYMELLFDIGSVKSSLENLNNIYNGVA